jgi:hypothetical protein
VPLIPPYTPFTSTKMAIELSEQEQASLQEGERIDALENARDEAVYTEAREASEQELKFAGKFRTADDLEKAYLELQKKLGEPRDKEESSEEEDVEEASESETEEETEEETEQVEEEEQEPAFTQEEVDSILEYVGGPDVYQKALDWAEGALTQEEQDEFNSVLEEASSPAVAKYAIENLVNRYKANADFQGKQLRGRPSGLDGAKPFRSRAEVSAAIQDPRYDRDPAYRNDVADRLAVSADDLL